MLVEGQTFVNWMEKECSKGGKHYKLPLLLRVPDELFPNKVRQKNNNKIFSRCKQYHQDYARFIEGMSKKGYADNPVKQVEQSKTFLIPHHGVYHASKPGKVHAVFYCSAEYSGGVSVNKGWCLVQTLQTK